MIKDIFGTDVFQFFITQYFFAIVGVAISLLLNAADRNQNSPSTPVKFDLLFLLKDNWKRILLNLLLIFVTIRFFTEITGIQLSLFWCLAVGLGLDKLAQLIKEKTNFLAVKRDVPPVPPSV